MKRFIIDSNGKVGQKLGDIVIDGDTFRMVLKSDRFVFTNDRCTIVMDTNGIHVNKT